MKISYRTHPALEYLNSNKKLNLQDHVGTLPLADNDFINTVWEHHKIACSKSIIKLTDNFELLALQNMNKLVQEVLKGKNDILTGEAGTMLFKSGETICYDFNNKMLVFFAFVQDKLVYANHAKHGCVMPTSAYEQFGKSKGIEIGLHRCLKKIGSIILFKKYAPIETKVVGANKRVKDFNCKYVNDTDSDITILDSTWFTTLVKSEGFKVRGHFRLQPYGPGMKEKRLIWIKDFEKTGYTREAKRPLNDDELPNSTEQQ